jgi:hypothetical protein
LPRAARLRGDGVAQGADAKRAASAPAAGFAAAAELSLQFIEQSIGDGAWQASVTWPWQVQSEHVPVEHSAFVLQI